MQFIDLAAQQARIREEIDTRVARVLDHGRYIMGPEVAELEAALAEFSGVDHVVSCASGTDALVMALMVLGVGPGDAVFVPTFTFAAPAEAVAILGATPVFVDVDDVTFNIDVAKLSAAIDATPDGLRPVGVIAVDLFGLPANYHAIDDLLAGRDMWVVADAAQSFGASRDGRRVVIGTRGLDDARYGLALIDKRGMRELRADASLTRCGFDGICQYILKGFRDLRRVDEAAFVA